MHAITYGVSRDQMMALLGEGLDWVIIDEAWYGYARFNPMYRDRYAMRGSPTEHPADGPTVFATHSTHKLLAALSQTSYIHIRDGRGAIDHGRFNEAYCSQASTSPLYALIVSNDVTAAMMDGPGGLALGAGLLLLLLRPALCENAGGSTPGGEA